MTAHSSQLLVSVQNWREAELTCQLGVPWIDLKNPAVGALGAPTPDMAVACLAAIAAVARQSNQAPPQTSVALGELAAIDPTTAQTLLQHFPLGKFGLAGMTDARLADRQSRMLSDLQHASQTPGQLVPAIYADHQRAQALPPEAVLELASRLSARFVLIDTFIKDGRGLFDWFKVPELVELQNRVRQIGAELVVAGSLHSVHWPQLRALEAAIIGVRGSVCDTRSNRSSGINAQRVSEWLAWTRETSEG